MTNSNEQFIGNTASQTAFKVGPESASAANDHNSIWVGDSAKAGHPVTPVWLDNDRLKLHALIVDPDPAGYGRHALLDQIVSQQVARGGAVVIFDSEFHSEIGSLLQASLQRFARDFGRSSDVRSVDPFAPRLSHTYNMFFDSSAEAAAEKAMSLIPSAGNSPGAEYYRQQAAYAIKVIAGALNQASIAYTPVDLAMFLMQEDAIDALRHEARDRYPDSRETAALENWLDASHGKENSPRHLKEICGGMSGRLYMIGQGRLGRVFNTYRPEVTMRDVLDNRRLAVFQLPTGGMFDLSTLLRKMILIDFRRAVLERERPNESVPPLVIFNGKDMLGAEVGRVLTDLRIGGVSAWVAASSVADADERILANTWTKFVFNLAGSQEHQHLIPFADEGFKPTQFDSLHERECALLNPTDTDWVVSVPKVARDDMPRHEFFGHVDAGEDVHTGQEEGASRFFRSFFLRDGQPG
ncbi:hypothetical protein A9R05_44525 (plasmid) [Burkholderia sp. KK1]|uniref:Uncharacterized protein n=1 Tax=Burkholderia sp. M701 TaxID=326454 RepID=V5YPK5_9BURK|nr:hypothetical protein [Burkholderia sp. M701]AQH06013.1 hypothetical protein A9R05_44525 [Burkholderia sp. KK1]BAO19253.1 hypothetical protein [Burkholderia sp. M701]